jgi:hypothetical protein
MFIAPWKKRMKKGGFVFDDGLEGNKEIKKKNSMELSGSHHTRG